MGAEPRRGFALITTFDRDPIQYGQATALAQLVIGSYIIGIIVVIPVEVPIEVIVVIGVVVVVIPIAVVVVVVDPIVVAVGWVVVTDIDNDLPVPADAIATLRFRKSRAADVPPSLGPDDTVTVTE